MCENDQTTMNARALELELLEQEMEKYQYCIKVNKAIDTLATPLTNYQYQINKNTHAQREREGEKNTL